MRNYLLLIAVLMLASLLSGCQLQETSESTNTAAQQSVATSDSVSLSWSAPSSRSDGNYLSVSDLAGYKVYMGSSESNMTQLVDLNDYNITGYTVDNLESGSYYFAVTAYDNDGLESGFSQVIRVDVS